MKAHFSHWTTGLRGVEARLAGGAGRVETLAPGRGDFGAVGAGEGEVAVVDGKAVSHGGDRGG